MLESVIKFLISDAGRNLLTSLAAIFTIVAGLYAFSRWLLRRAQRRFVASTSRPQQGEAQARALHLTLGETLRNLRAPLHAVVRPLDIRKLATLENLEISVPYVAAVFGGVFFGFAGMGIVAGFTFAMFEGIGFPVYVGSFAATAIFVLANAVVIRVAIWSLRLATYTSLPAGELHPANFVLHWLAILTAGGLILFPLVAFLFGILGVSSSWPTVVVTSFIIVVIGLTGGHPLYWAIVRPIRAELERDRLRLNNIRRT